MGTKASQMMQVVYMVKAMYLASLKLAGTLRVFKRENQRESVSKHSNISLSLLNFSVDSASNWEHKTRKTLLNLTII